MSEDNTKIDFSVSAVLPGTLATCLANLTAPFRGQKLLVIIGARDFLITSIEIDGVEFMPPPPRPMAPGECGMPCGIFGEDAHDDYKKLELPEAKNTLQFRVFNESSESADFFASFYGEGGAVE